ncbi:hypothetical protein BGZ61DRAFT_74829 [Ilyonectria robusta]|uniref:uncharacterized protein n=1 Tax=Ilyonectria robusta TaxID=1079257 RepID=UPI001E8D04B0|nr:uncharacterized protein BGZ61DRAFT_74829 [Ilyonectria robusta]KAH8677113.1 hypothetical protein BGZ61DRAFT_74829 [Ilyonectria robusta]
MVWRAGWLCGCMAVLMSDWLVGWLAGWLADWLAENVKCSCRHLGCMVCRAQVIGAGCDDIRLRQGFQSPEANPRRTHEPRGWRPGRRACQGEQRSDQSRGAQEAQGAPVAHA